MGTLDSALFHAINRGSKSWAPLMIFMSDAMGRPGFRIFLAVLAIGMLARSPRSRQAIIQALIAFPIANGITDLFKHFLPFPRPFQVEDAILRVGASDSMGTASAHSANMAAVAFVITYRLGGWGVPWIVAAALTALSRVYNGVHYPSQVLLGALCGILAGLAVVKTFDAIQRRTSRPRADAPGPSRLDLGDRA